MSRNMIELPGGGYATESEALSALAREAKRRKTSYGMLVANTTERERAEIIRDYCADKGRKRKKNSCRMAACTFFSARKVRCANRRNS